MPLLLELEIIKLVGRKELQNNYKGKKIAELVVILNVMLTFILLFNSTALTVYSSVAIYINSGAVAFAIIVNRKIHFRTLVFFVLSVSFMMIAISINSGGIGSVLTYVASILALDLISTLDFKEVNVKALTIFITAVIIGLLVFSLRYRQNFDYYEHNGVNPNTIGMFALYAFCLSVCLGRRKWINLVLFLFTALIMLNAQSRGALLALLAYVVLALLPKKLFTKKIVFILTTIIIGIGIAVPFIYINLYNSGFRLEILNKRLFTGRERIWIRALNYFSTTKYSWLLGIGSKAELWDAATNVHNCFFGIIVNFGIVGLVLYLLYIRFFINEVSKYTFLDNNIKNWFCAYLSTNLVLGFSETSIFWSMVFFIANISLGRAFNLSQLYEKDIDYDT